MVGVGQDAAGGGLAARGRDGPQGSRSVAVNTKEETDVNDDGRGDNHRPGAVRLPPDPPLSVADIASRAAFRHLRPEAALSYTSCWPTVRDTHQSVPSSMVGFAHKL